MISKNRVSLLAMVIGLVVAVSNSGCGGGSAAPPPTDFIVQLGAPSILQPGTTANIGASVGSPSSGPDKSGVNHWTVTCSTAPCGSISPIDPFNATYTAPGTRPSSNVIVTITATSVSYPTKSGSTTITVLSVAVAVAPGPAAIVESGGKQQFSATVTGDSKNAGVTWSLAKSFQCHLDPGCGPGGPSCDSSCGTLSAASTASGAPVTYAAPVSLPSFPPGSFNRQLLLTAISVADSAASTSVSITIPPISVSVSAGARVALDATEQLTATVTNDGTNGGVIWSLSQNGVACAPACGTITPTSSASGGAVTYTAPATGLALPAVTVTATSVEDNTKSGGATMLLTTASDSGRESLLSGQYAFLLQGFDSGGGSIGICGSITADGTGKIIGGELDSYASITSQVDAMVDPVHSVYSVGPDHRGFLALAIAGAGTAYFRFSMGSLNGSNTATTGRIIEFDDATGQGKRAVGTIRLQDPGSFTAASFKGNFVFGVTGGSAGYGVFALAGTFTSDGASAIFSGVFDFDRGDVIGSSLSSTPGASFTCCSANGRGTLNLQINTTAFASSNFVFYLVSGTDALVGTNIRVDMGGGFIGEAFGVPSGTTFDAASLSGTSILRNTAQANPIVNLSTVSADGKGTITVNDNQNNAGTFATSSEALNYLVASNGRVTFSGGTTPPVLYLYGPNQGFLVGTDPNVTFGILEPQRAGPFSNASFSGPYTLGTENPSTSTVTMESGVVTADGKGSAAGTSDQSSSAGLVQNQPFNFAYSLAANGTGNVGSGTTAMMISGNKLVFLNNTSSNPTITVVEK